MMRKGPSPIVASFLVTTLVVSSQLLPRVEADCDATQLTSCLPCFVPPYPDPVDECCGKLKEQRGCLCNYKKDPRYSKYVSSPRAKKVLEDCHVPYPICPLDGPIGRRNPPV